MATEALAPSPIDRAELLDALLTSVFVLDAELRVVDLNAAAQTLLGLGASQALGRPVGELLRGADLLAALLERVLARRGEEIVQRELAWQGPLGVELILACAATVATLGSEIRVILEIEDITQHRRRIREAALLAQLDGSRLMIRQLAHEIKNPLGGVRGAAQLLERELLDPALREYTRVIISEADRLAGLLDTMQGPGRPPSKQAVNVHEMLERVYRLLRGEASSRITIERDYDPSLPTLTVDPNHIIQAMLNLGRNALQALESTAADGARLVLRTRAAINVTLGAQRHRVVASIQFEDNGPGVPPEIRDTIFYPLVSGRDGGSGFGLAVAQDLVTRHGGLIEFDSAPGRTVFTLSLPMDTE